MKPNNSGIAFPAGIRIYWTDGEQSKTVDESILQAFTVGSNNFPVLTTGAFQDLVLEEFQHRLAQFWQYLYGKYYGLDGYTLLPNTGEKLDLGSCPLPKPTKQIGYLQLLMDSVNDYHVLLELYLQDATVEETIGIGFIKYNYNDDIFSSHTIGIKIPKSSTAMVIGSELIPVFPNEVVYDFKLDGSSINFSELQSNFIPLVLDITVQNVGGSALHEIYATLRRADNREFHEELSVDFLMDLLEIGESVEMAFYLNVGDFESTIMIPKVGVTSSEYMYFDANTAHINGEPFYIEKKYPIFFMRT